MPRLLLVEDEPKLRESLAAGLRLENWTIATAGTGGDALGLIDAEPFDLLVLDWMLPDIDGIELLRRVHASIPRLPVLMITARNAHSDQALAFANGATGYVTKPFAFADLLGRCRALLAPTLAQHVSYGELALDLESRILRIRDRELPLSEMETSLVEFFLRNPHDIISADALARHVWKGLAISVSLEPAIEIQIHRLNEKLRDHGATPLIRPVPGAGYTTAPAASAPPPGA